jgi:hypothetical protein
MVSVLDGEDSGFHSVIATGPSRGRRRDGARNGAFHWRGSLTEVSLSSSAVPPVPYVNARSANIR